ncbi:MAG: ABC transporter substrate-binding protein [Tissierella sp.]|uniref:ABC transporter substrate-binding protein n=1 Tax=Tissierella sp. TaxID=41274 RepID=UPI003F9E6EFC
MKRKSIILLCILCLVFVISGCSKENEEGNVEVEDIQVVLDWTPNTNHTGLYVALEKGYFEKNNLNVEMVQPPEDGATALVSTGKAQFGIDFQDYMAPALAREEPLPVTALAALIQHNTSGIISRKGEGIDTPKGMSGKTYATWDLPVEKEIIKSVVEKDGGNYEDIKMVPSTVTDVVTALNTDIDAVWIYYGWDGIATEVKGLETDYFAFKDILPVLDYYSPVLIGNDEYIEKNSEETKLFLQAVAKGYEYAIENPEEAANILIDFNPELDEELVIESQKWLANEYKADVENWGYIDQERWDGFYDWLFENDLIEREIPEGFGFTNDYLPN